MLELKHIMHLKLPTDRMTAHTCMPPPPHATKPLMVQLSSLGGAALAQLMQLTPVQFGEQLRRARSLGAELIATDANRKTVGVSMALSVVKPEPILGKHMIVPSDFMRFRPQLSDHFVIGAFVRGNVENGHLNFDGNIDIAGWANAEDIQSANVMVRPTKFQTKLDVIMVPCTSLRPISELLASVDACTLSV